MKQTYNAILEHLIAKLPELRWIDEQKGQMRFERPPVAFPACLIDIAFPRTNNITTKIQEGQLLLEVDFCFDYTANTSSNAFTKADRDKGLKHWDLVHKGEKALQGFESPYFNHLERISVGDKIKRPGYKVITVTFRGTFREDLN